MEPDEIIQVRRLYHLTVLYLLTLISVSRAGALWL